MNYCIIMTNKAVNDLVSIDFYLSKKYDNPLLSNKIINEIIEAIDSLTYLPLRHRIYLNNVHIYNINNFKIFYYINNENIYILRILNNKQAFNYYDVLN